MTMKFLLSRTPTTECRVQVGTDGVKLSQQIQFDFSNESTATLEWFLQQVKSDTSTRHTYTDGTWNLEYDPRNGDLDKVCITRRTTGREMTLAISTAYKLLDALTGNTERLVKEEEESSSIL